MGDLQSMYKNKNFTTIMMVALMLGLVSCSSAEKVAGNKVDGARNIASTSDAAMDLDDIDDDGLPASEVNTDVDKVGGFIENRKTGDLLVLACSKADEKKVCSEFSFVIVKERPSISPNPKIEEPGQKNIVLNKRPMNLEQVKEVAALAYRWNKTSPGPFFGVTVATWNKLAVMTGSEEYKREGAAGFDTVSAAAFISSVGGAFASIGFSSLIPLGVGVALPVLPSVIDVAKAPFMYSSVGIVNAVRKHRAKTDKKLFDKVLIDNVTAYRKVSNRRFERLIRAIEVAGQ
jgi:hypothetical protein